MSRVSLSSLPPVIRFRASARAGGRPCGAARRAKLFTRRWDIAIAMAVGLYFLGNILGALS
jgi:hypothetical protein